MKIQTKHYQYLKTEIAKVWTPEIEKNHRAYIVGEGKAKDVDMRLCFDLSYAAKLTPWICDNLYSYMNDNHLHTALKKVLCELRKEHA